jgi:hypothetical protein
MEKPRSKGLHISLVDRDALAVAQRGDVVPPLPLRGLNTEELGRGIHIEGTNIRESYESKET